uniref:VWFA domain-containing protein n=1 Tax=Globisporangium ultimum (strain ATCC 200006 / CBS 805.95 / DAOM BR144) TaxID=431595 RepID=K3WVX3_GLOUD
MSFADAVKQLASAVASTSAVAATTTATTWNGAVSHASSGTARVDFFYGALRYVEKERFLGLLSASYEEDPLHTLKLIAYIRDSRGGKGEREIGRWSLDWLANHHPKELKHNLKQYIGEYGRFDDPAAVMGSQVEQDALELLRAQLIEDLAILKQGKDNSSISLCAKWIPSEKKALDKKLKMNKKLSKHMGIPPAELRKVYLAPLREKLRILERSMCANKWEEIEFSEVPSVAMHIHGKPNHAFERHLGEKFAAWKGDLATGKAKVNAKVLFPHQVVAQYMQRSAVDELLEAQWKVMIEDASKMGSVKKTLVLSDVSGSMSGRPMEVSIALGLLISSLALDEYKDLVLTFESTSQFHHVVGANLFERVTCLRRAPWGGSTDFATAFRAILALAKKNNLAPDQMPERLIVVSDMQFNSADCNFKTNYQVLKQEFEEAMYMVPHLVFWNVNGSVTDVPTFSGEAKVSLVSGFSTSILKCVLAGVEVTPLQTVLEVVLDPRYDAITLPTGDNEGDRNSDDGVLI